jgi:uncharacterized cupin superfamily protein
MSGKAPLAVVAHDVPPRTRPSTYPEPFFSRMKGRQKRQLGDIFGLKNFGVNLTRLSPGGESSLMHRHSRQEEFVFILAGAPTLVTDQGEVELRSGMCAGFPARGIAHHLVNRTDQDVFFLEVGDRTPDDEGSYPADDLAASMGTDVWKYRLDGVGQGTVPFSEYCYTPRSGSEGLRICCASSATEGCSDDRTSTSSCAAFSSSSVE